MEIILVLPEVSETCCSAETALVFWALLTRTDYVPSLETEGKRKALSLCCSQRWMVACVQDLLAGGRCLDPNFCGIKYLAVPLSPERCSSVGQHAADLKNVPERSGTFSV